MKIFVEKSQSKPKVGERTIVIPLFEDQDRKGGVFEWSSIGEEISEILHEKEFLGKKGEVLILPKKKSKGRTVLVGLGKSEHFQLEVWKRSLGKGVRFLQERKILQFSIFLPGKIEEKLGVSDALRWSTEVLFTASYQFQEYLTNKDRVFENLKEITFLVEGERVKKEDEAQVKEGSVLGEAINRTRHLGNLPAIQMTPAYLAEEAKKLAKKYPKLKVKIFGQEQIRKEGMGGLLGVSSGSAAEPKFIILEWMNAPKAAGVRVFAGKSITFDSGGLSIKPASKMDEMKFDMLGGGAVLGAMRAIAELKLKVNVVGLLPATENLSGSGAYRPGDILRAKNGKTIEVLNTDAEGRVVLADALSYAEKYKPKVVLDLATLTGACMVALGGNYAGLFGRNEDVLAEVKEAANRAGEKVWPLPIDDDFVQEVTSPIADVRNLGEGPGGGASTAAAFLEAFTNYPWAHLDIAGVAWGSGKPYIRAGATGFGVSLLVELAKKWEKQA
ncbi:MAG TPA: leucyl aminopeptidase [Candidatus Paceibacterota bacterium]|nr:leucyl aminopeptidase [Candidatus Paceibacterota bacterium]